jgi:SAM-dependent methyltransferase
VQTENPVTTSTRKPRTLIFIAPYRNESTFADLLGRIPECFAGHKIEVLVINESSCNRDSETGWHSLPSMQCPVTILHSGEDPGYGGCRKLAFQYAIRNDYEYIVLLDSDRPSDPGLIPTLLKPLLDGSADAALGSRMLVPGAARAGGMPAYRFVGNKTLTFIQNWLLGSDLSDFSPGFRAYRVSALKRIPFCYNANAFCFDIEVFLQLILAGSRIVEVPIPTHGGKERRSIRTLPYAKDVLWTTILYRLQQWNVFYHRKYDVAGVQNRYYDLKLGYRSSHTMALDAVPPSTRVLDIGCGPGFFAEELIRKGCIVTGMDQFPPSRSGAFRNFFLWEEGKAYPPIDLRNYDTVLLLDLIEHLTQPEAFLNWLRESARSYDGRPAFIVTSGNIVFFLVRIQALFGNFNYGKRGILDLTHSRMYTFSSLRNLFEQSGFRVARLEGIPAPWPKALGRNSFTLQLVRLNTFLIRLMKGLFSYQIFLVATPTPTVDALLDETIGSSSRMETGTAQSAPNGSPSDGNSRTAENQPTMSLP